MWKSIALILFSRTKEKPSKNKIKYKECLKLAWKSW